MTRYDDTIWTPIVLILVFGLGLAGGVAFSEVVMDPQQADARAAITPEKPAVSAPQAIHTLRGARTACTALHERLEGMQLPSHSPVVVEGE